MVSRSRRSKTHLHLETKEHLMSFDEQAKAKAEREEQALNAAGAEMKKRLPTIDVKQRETMLDDPKGEGILDEKKGKGILDDMKVELLQGVDKARDKIHGATERDM
jgi:hypothetical protein